MDEDYVNHVEELCKFLNDEEKLRLFDLLYDTVGKRKTEEIHLALGLKLQAVYRYLASAERRVVPNHRTTARIAKALQVRGRCGEVISFLDLAAERMREVYRTYVSWRRGLAHGLSLSPIPTLGCSVLSTHVGESYNTLDQVETPENMTLPRLLGQNLMNAGCALSSVPENSEEPIMEVFHILNYIRRSEPTKEMKIARIEEGIGKLRELFLADSKARIDAPR